jgi:hypothetical protein
MSLDYYLTDLEENDYFEAIEQAGGFSFPCNACIHRKRSATEEPCLKCGHNVNSEEE